MNAGGRLNTCKSNGNSQVAILELTSGARVRNAYATYLQLEHNVEKLALIFHVVLRRHLFRIKDSLIEDGHAYH